MHTFFVVLFGVGAGFVIISFLIGAILGVIDFSTPTDLGFEVSGASPLKPQVLSVFLTVFGGVGLLAEKSFHIYVILSLASFAGLVAAFFIYRFVIIPLAKRESKTPDIQSLIGLRAKVTEAVVQGGFGKITYHADGNTYVSPAKSSDGGYIARGSYVRIAHFESKYYYVEIIS
jgi:membrane protein implicated in regulation of membrane protease activity